MLPTFTPTKLQNLIVFIVAEIGRDLGAIELAKIVYLIDAESVCLIGETITGERYTRQEKGPLPENFGNAIDGMDGFEINVSISASRGNSSFPKHKHVLGTNLRFQPMLNSSKSEIARRVIRRIKDLDPMRKEKLAYESEPMLLIVKKKKTLDIL